MSKTTEVAPGLFLIALKGNWGTDLELNEISLVIDSPEGAVLG